MSQPPEWQPPEPGYQPQWSPPPGAQWPAPLPPPAAPPGPQWDYLGGSPTGEPPPPKKSGRGRLIASLVAVSALVAGGVATYVAVSDSSTDRGAGSPEAAIRTIVGDINKSDLIGVLNDLVPGERTAIAAPFTDLVNQLKRTKVLQPGAAPATITGLQVQLKQLTFSGTTIPLNDHVQVLELTGGTIDLSADLERVPLTAEFLKAIFPRGIPQSTSGTQHVDIAQQGAPLRIATQKVGSSWYPSLFYTVAYQAAGERAPAAGDAVPARGAASAEDAVKQLIDALLAGSVDRAIALVSPDELPALHDYGKKVLAAVGSYRPAPVHLEDLTFTTADIAGGKRVTLSSIALTNQDGSKTSVKVDAGCFSISYDGQTKRQCPADLIDTATQSFGFPTKVTAAQRQAITDLIAGLGKVGVDTSQTGGQWFVAPVRTYFDLENEILSQLKGNDVIELVDLITSFVGN